MKRTAWPYFAATAVFFFLALSANAQMTPTQQAQVSDSNPNSIHYNTRYLPSRGHGGSDYPWIDRFGAFAMSRSTGWSGWSQGADSEEIANSAALSQCQERGGGVDDCAIIVSFQNQCASVVRSANHTAYSRDDSLRKARSSAMRRCNEMGGPCEVFREGCSMPELKP